MVEWIREIVATNEWRSVFKNSSPLCYAAAFAILLSSFGSGGSLLFIIYASSLQRPLNLSAVVVGTCSTMLFLGISSLSMPLLFFSRKIGRQRMLLVVSLLAAVAPTLLYCIQRGLINFSISLLFFLFFLSGITESVIYNLNMSLFLDGLLLWEWKVGFEAIRTVAFMFLIVRGAVATIGGIVLNLLMFLAFDDAYNRISTAMLIHGIFMSITSLLAWLVLVWFLKTEKVRVSIISKKRQLEIQRERFVPQVILQPKAYGKSELVYITKFNSQIIENTKHKPEFGILSSNLIRSGTYQAFRFIIIQNFKSIKFWCIEFIGFVVLGVGTAIASGSRTLPQALGYEISDNLIEVSSNLLLLGQLMGRVLPSIVFFSKNPDISVYDIPTVATPFGFVGLLIMSLYFSYPGICIAMVCVGISTGAILNMWPLAAILQPGGLDNFEIMVGLIGGSAFFGILLCNLIVAQMYDYKATPTYHCLGEQCFTISFWTMVAVMFTAFMVSIALTVTSHAKNYRTYE